MTKFESHKQNPSKYVYDFEQPFLNDCTMLHIIVYYQNFYGGEGVVDGGSSDRCLKWGGGDH